MADFETLLDAQLSSYKSGFNPGDRVRGFVTNITHPFVILDVNAKREGLVATADLMQEDGTLSCKVGDSIDVIFAGMKDGAFLFSTNLSSKSMTLDQSISDAFS